MAGIYVHIPFCSSRCIYCGFYSTVGLSEMQDRYISAIQQEYEMRHDYLSKAPIKTLYIGGGTPSVLSEENIQKLSKTLYQPEETEEFTIECNPDDITSALCKTLKECGANRISMGVQTFSNERLRFLNRRHTAEDIPIAVKLLKEAGIDNISIDLMFGFPQETPEEWLTDIRKAIALDIKHISAYSLMYEEGTRLYRMLQDGTIRENDENVCVEMYDILIDELIRKGFEHYEISNFAMPGFRSRHNSSYWNATEYMGLGAAAHSFNTMSRQWNVSNVTEYITEIEAGRVPAEKEEIDERTRYNDMITTALRTVDGIDLANLSADDRKYIMKNAELSLKAGTLENDGNRLRLTRKGLYICDDIMSDLIRL